MGHVHWSPSTVGGGRRAHQAVDLNFSVHAGTGHLGHPEAKAETRTWAQIEANNGSGGGNGGSSSIYGGQKLGNPQWEAGLPVCPQNSHWWDLHKCTSWPEHRDRNCQQSRSKLSV